MLVVEVREIEEPAQKGGVTLMECNVPDPATPGKERHSPESAVADERAELIEDEALDRTEAIDEESASLAVALEVGALEDHSLLGSEDDHDDHSELLPVHEDSVPTPE